MRVLRSFYRELGWPELTSGDDTWTGFLLGGVLLALFPVRDLTAEAAPGKLPRPPMTVPTKAITTSWTWNVSKATAVDTFGAAVEVKMEQGKLTLPVSVTPIFVEAAN